jgi:hypothetical protein
VATKAQIAAVEALVRESVGNVDRMAPESLRAVLPALRQAREELQRDLGDWISTVDNGADRFTAYEKTRALRALEGALDRVRELGPAVAQGLAVGRKATGALSISNLDTEITRLSSIFGDGLVVMPQIDTAAILARGERMLWKQHARSAARYAGNVGDDIRHLFAVGLAKHETFEQLVTRLRRVGGGRGVGLAGDASGEIADGLFRRYKFQADRLVRTELMHAYNVQHSDAIEAVNELRPEDEDPWLRRWDAAADVVTCPLCKELDHTVTTIEGVFRYGIKNPPAHPHCRCVVLAWLARWGGIKGELPHRGELPPVPPRKITPDEQPRLPPGGKRAKVTPMVKPEDHEPVTVKPATPAPKGEPIPPPPTVDRSIPEGARLKALRRAGLVDRIDNTPSATPFAPHRWQLNDRGLAHFAAKREKDAKRAKGIGVGVCQICERECAIVRGRISLHGYNRPGYGFITGQCRGSHQPPWSQSCAALAAWVDELAAMLASDTAALERLPDRAEFIVEGRRYDKNVHKFVPTFETVSESDPRFGAARDAAREKLEGRIEALRAEIKRQGARLRSWKPTEQIPAH